MLQTLFISDLSLIGLFLSIEKNDRYIWTYSKQNGRLEWLNKNFLSKRNLVVK